MTSAGVLAGLRVAVTGGTGFLGPHVVRALSEAGARASVLARPSSDRSRLASFRPRWVDGDLADSSALAELARDASVFVHVAGLTSAGSSAAYAAVNVEGTRRAVRAAAAAGARVFVLVSSQAAAGPTAPGAAPRREDDPPDPRSGYGKTKRESERVVEEEGGAIPVRAILRPGAVYGPYDRAFLAYFRFGMLGLRPVLGRGERVFQPVFAPDVAAACVAAAGRGRAGCRAYFVVGPETVTWNGFGAALAEAMKKRTRRVPVPEAAVLPRLLGLLPVTRALADRLADVLPERWEADASRAAAELEWTARTPLGEGLARTWEWYRENNWL